MNTKKALTYNPGMSRQTTLNIIMDVGIPLFVFAVSLFTISVFGRYGTRIICPAISLMWILGMIAAFLLPVERKQTLNQTAGMCIIYCAMLLGLKMALAMASGVSAEMIAASYNQPIPLASGNALPGMLQNMMSIGSALVPGSYLFMLIKKIVQYRKTQSLQKEFTRTRGMSESGKNHTWTQ